MKKIYLVPHTHYDVAWAFTKEEYLKINEGILKKVVELMKIPRFKFCLEQAFLLQAMEERNPELWSKLKELIKEGRIEIVDGQYLMPDTMLPSGEVLVREILFGKRYFRQKFGIDVPVAWAADSFGLNSQLPQIYRKSGYRWFGFRRGARRDITRSEFLWKGLDGTTILSHWMPLGYRAGLDFDKWEKSLFELDKFAASPLILMPSGSGSMPPQEEIFKAVDEWNGSHPQINMEISTVSEFFKALEERGRFETLQGELYDDTLVDVFPQVCSSRAWLVQDARKYDALIFTTEQFATLAWLTGGEYPERELKEAWKKLLFIAFHDVITGCGIDEIYEEARENFAFLEHHLNKILEDSLELIAGKIDLEGEGVVVFNPLPWEVSEWVEVDLRLDGKEKIGIEEVESELVEEERDEKGKLKRAKIGFIANVPALGYKAYKVIEGGKGTERAQKVFGNKIENEFFRLWVDENTGILEIRDKEGGFLAKGNELVIEDEIGDLYHHRSRFRDLIKSESGEGFEYGGFKPKGFRIEESPIRAKIIFENEYFCLRWPYRLVERFKPQLWSHNVMDISKEIVIYKNLPRIDFITKVANRYPNIRLRVKFDTGIRRMSYSRETQFGVIDEPTRQFVELEGRREALPGIPHFLTWFDYSDGIRGLTFINKGIPANEIMDDSVYMTLFRSVYGLSADGISGPLIPTPDALELRDYTFKYALYPHEGDWREGKSFKQAQQFDHALMPVQISRKEGELPSQISFFKLKPDNLIISAFKKAEEGEELILRFFETKGEATKAEIEAFTEIKKAKLVDLLERDEKEVPVLDGRIELEVRPFEIITLKLKV